MKIDRTFLSSKVGRRMVLLFVLCALLPITVLAIISLNHVTKNLYEQSRTRLHQASKTLGMAMYERLLFLETKMKMVASDLRDGPNVAARRSVEVFDQGTIHPFISLALVTHAKRHVSIFGRTVRPPKPTPEEWQHLLTGKTLVSSRHRPGSQSKIFMSRALDLAHPNQGILVGEVNEKFLWGLGEKAILPTGTELCVFDPSSALLASSFKKPFSFPAQGFVNMSRSATGHFDWRQNGEEYLASFWSLPLKFSFFTPKWTVVLSEAKAAALSPLAHFKYNFSLVLLMALCVVSLFSINQIRRILVPLEKLQEGTRRLAMKDFSSRVNVTSGDEFEDLAVSFNVMAGRLDRQFLTLATMAKIDRAILSTPETENIVDPLLTQIRDLFPCDSVSVTLRDPNPTGGARLFFRDHHSENRTLVESVEFTPGEIESLRHATDYLVIEDKNVLPSLHPLVGRGIKAFLTLPIFLPEGLSGLITLGYLNSPAFTQEDLVLARQLADQVAVAFSTARDITGRKLAENSLRESNRQLRDTLAELKATQKQIIQQERLRALGQMASGIAHDFNNALSPVVGFSELLLKDPNSLDDKARVRESLEIIHTAGRDAANAVARLREFYRPLEKDEMSESLHLNTLVEEAIKLTQPKWKHQALDTGVTIRVETDLHEVPPIAGNMAELREVLTNLIFNAVDALSQNGTITLRTRPDTEYVLLEVSDTGEGMTEEVRQRCMEPFFSTKGDRGTGLGLSMVYGIIRRHQGIISVRSEPGEETTFSIRLPICLEQVNALQNQGKGSTITPLHILVVDDDFLSCRVTEAYLVDAGHVVETASNGWEGLRKFQTKPFDLVVTDQGMPEMSGDQLASAIKQVAPKVPVLLLTGGGSILPDGGSSPSMKVDEIVSKPLTMTALEQALAKMTFNGSSGRA